MIYSKTSETPSPVLAEVKKSVGPRSEGGGSSGGGMMMFAILLEGGGLRYWCSTMNHVRERIS